MTMRQKKSVRERAREVGRRAACGYMRDYFVGREGGPLAGWTRGGVLSAGGYRGGAT